MRFKEHIANFDLHPISDSLLHGPITQEMIDYILLRNEEKRQASISYLGEKWLLHPANMAQRKGFQ
jgi:hypothetical protein